MASIGISSEQMRATGLYFKSNSLGNLTFHELSSVISHDYQIITRFKKYFPTAFIFDYRNFLRALSIQAWAAICTGSQGVLKGGV